MPNITTNHAITYTNCQVRDKSHTVRTWQTSNHTEQPKQEDDC